MKSLLVSSRLVCLLIILLFAFCSSPGTQGNNKGMSYPPGVGNAYAFKYGKDSFITAILVNMLDQDGTNWYGLSFTDIVSKEPPSALNLQGARMFGRKVHSMIDDKGYRIGIDVVFVNDSFLISGDSVRVLDHLLLDLGKIEVGAGGYADSYGDFIRRFEFGRSRRTSPPDHYTEHLTKLDKFRPDEYFPISMFKRTIY